MTVAVVILSVLLLAAVVALWMKSKTNVGAKSRMQELETSFQILSAERDRLSAQDAKAREEVAILQEKLSVERMENARLKEKIDNMENFNATLQKETESKFKVLANEIFDRHTKDFRQTSEQRLAEILKPLKDNISDFQKTITDTYVNETKERSALNQHLQHLMELNKSIGKEARELTEALTGNTKVQGDWGELVLESILEKSGLIEGENYYVQKTHQDEGGTIVGDNSRRLRPDVVVVLPDKKYIVIDSKVSLSAYVNYVNADSEEEREKYGKAHVASVRAHLRELENKRYQDYVGMEEDSRMDYVLMFIPNEHAYMAAMSLDKNLWADAYEKRVVVISPAHVISTLRLIAQLWNRDKQTKNALKIAEEGGKLYDKFVGFVEDMEGIGNGLQKARDSYEKAFNKLQTGNGNLISKTQKLKELGAKAIKSLPAN